MIQIEEIINKFNDHCGNKCCDNYYVCLSNHSFFLASNYIYNINFVDFIFTL